MKIALKKYPIVKINIDTKADITEENNNINNCK